MLMRTKTEKKSGAREIILSIVRMSQKALICVLAMMAVGFLGGLIAIFFRPDLAEAMTKYAEVYIPAFQLEIGVYGLGSAVENVTKIKTQIDSLNKQNDTVEQNG